MAGDRHAPCGKGHVLITVAGGAAHARRTKVCLPAHNGGLVHLHIHPLPRRIIDRVTVQAARMPDHHHHFLEQRGRTFRLPFDGIKLVDRAQTVDGFCHNGACH